MKKIILVLTFFSSAIFGLEYTTNPLQCRRNDPAFIDLINKAEQISKEATGWYSKAKVDAITAIIINTKPKLCVEVGVFGGSSLLPMAFMVKKLQCGQIIGIDSWNNQHCTQYMDNEDPNKAWWSQINLNSVADSLMQKIKSKGLRKICTIYREDSIQAADYLQDNSIEFLHWDGNHTFEGAVNEFKAFLPKVQPGGYILVSDALWTVSGSLPIAEAVIEVFFDSCSLVDTLDNDNLLLLQKQSDPS